MPEPNAAAVIDPPQPAAPVPEGEAPPPAAPEPAVAVSYETLDPETRGRVEPIFKPLQEKISTYEKQLEAAKSSQDKAAALDRLVQDPDFQKYWTGRNAKPAPVEQPTGLPYTPEEYQAAYDKAMQGDPSALAALNEKQTKSIIDRDITPSMNKLNQKAREIELGVELGTLLQTHPDARDLDKYGFLEPALHYYTDKLGKPMEFAYNKAKEAYDRAIGDYKVKEAKSIQDKRGSVTETPGIQAPDGGIVYLDTAEQVLRAQVNAAVKGEKVQYRVKPRR